MNEKYDALFTPWKIGNVEVKNRIVLAPMGGTCLFGWMELPHFDKEAAGLVLNIAQNNCGLVIPGIAPVRSVMGRVWLYQNKKMFSELKDYMKLIHAAGARLFIQLTAGFGRSMALPDSMALLAGNKVLNTLAKPVLDARYLTAAPSELPNRWADGVQCRPITKKEIDDIVYAFGEISRLCKEADVDGVEVHAVHEGYLLDQFTLKYTNHRTDEYGGSFENRYRFPVEIVKEIKKKCGDDFPVSLRYSVVSKTKAFREGAMPGEDYIEIGRDMSESEKAAKYLQDAGYDMLNCDNGTYDAWYWAHPPQYMPRNCNVADVTHIKKFVSIPVVCAGRMTPDTGAEKIAAGELDGAAFGRQFLADPQWITKLKNDEEDEIRPCICCHAGCFDLTKYEGSNNAQDLTDSLGMCRCAVNPQSMQSKHYKIVPAAHSKRVAVIGGGIGGMEAARVLKLRGHEPVIYEKSSVLGGVFIPAAAPDFKEQDKALIQWFRHQTEELGIEVHLNTEIKDISSLKADAYIIATGSVANKLKIPGSERAIDAVDYLNGAHTGNDVVIIGGGLSGCEIAYDLYRHGKKPYIVEMKHDLMAVKNLCLANSSYLRDFFRTNHVPVFVDTSVEEIGEDYVLVRDKNMKLTKLPADDIILSVGYRPAPAAVPSKYRARSGKVFVIGDAQKVGNLKSVIWDAWDAAMKI